MALATTYDIGDVPELFVTYTKRLTPTSPLTTLFDPATVTCLVMDPAGNETTYVYLTAPNLTRVSVGYFTLQIVATASGLWRYRWVSTGSPGQGEEELIFKVRPTEFYPGI